MSWGELGKGAESIDITCWESSWNFPIGGWVGIWGFLIILTNKNKHTSESISGIKEIKGNNKSRKSSRTSTYKNRQ